MIHNQSIQIFNIISLIKSQSLSKEHLNNINFDFLNLKKATNDFNWMVKSYFNNEFRKSLNHSSNLAKKIKPVANDNPFNVGDKVAVIRYEHCYYDGKVEAIISDKYQSNGIWKYSALIYNSYGKILEPDEQYQIIIHHTRDAFLIN